MQAIELAQCELWWKGSEFLERPREEWPEQLRVKATEAAAAETRTVEEIARTIILRSEGSEEKVDLGVTKGQLGMIQRFLDRGHDLRKSFQTLALLTEGLHQRFQDTRFNMVFSKWETIWVRHEQTLLLGKLYKELQGQRRPSHLLEFKPCLDLHEVVRVAAGLAHSLHHDWKMTYPILLHHKMRIAKEYMEYERHKGLAHQGGVSHLLGQTGKRFHVMGGKRLATQVIQQCFPCAKKQWKPFTKSLPEFHATRMGNRGLVAFNEIEIDHAGPFQLRHGRSTVKGYVLVILCCATRTVNLERSLSTGAEHVLAALQRHVGVFGSPEYINSDMAPGYVKARRVLLEHSDRFTAEGWDHTGKHQWRINIPYSPTWSAHVKITKEALRHLHSRPQMAKLTLDEFYTQLKRAQGYINMRPLVKASAEKVPLTREILLVQAIRGFPRSFWPQRIEEHLGSGTNN